MTMITPRPDKRASACPARDCGPLRCGKHGHSGFTVLEVLVALALLSIVLVVIFQLFSANLNGISKADDYVYAVIKAESIMRDILDDDKLEEKSFSGTTEDGYRFNAEITGTATEKTEKLQVKLLEIRLTVTWTRGMNEKSLSVKTMKVIPKKV